MKKKIIIISIVVTILIAMSVILGYLLSLREIDFEFSSNVSEITLYKKQDYDKKNNPIKIDESKKIKIQTGEYVIIPTGTIITNNPINITVSKDEQISIDPDYSLNYLSSIALKEKDNIYKLLAEKYPNLIKDYDIKSEIAFQKGEWFGGLLINKNSTPNSKKDIYRFVAYKNNQTWEIVNYPELLLSQLNYPKVPSEILNSINQLEYN